jgi:hypothetical protein
MNWYGRCAPGQLVWPEREIVGKRHAFPNNLFHPRHKVAGVYFGRKPVDMMFFIRDSANG